MSDVVGRAAGDAVKAAGAAVGIPPWAIPLAAVGASLALAGAIYGGIVLHGRSIQAQKDAPVIQAAQTTAVVAQGTAQVATKQIDNTAALTSALSKLAQRDSYAEQAVQAAPSDDAAYAAYVAGLRSLQDGSADVGSVPGGPSVARPPATPGGS